MDILLRVDASYKLGNGHLMRCLALIEFLTMRGHRATIACRELEGAPIEWLKSHVDSVVVLPAHTPDLSKASSVSDEVADWAEVPPKWDAENTLHCLLSRKFDWVVVDHYAWSHQEHAKMRDLGRKILVIDDLANRQYDADILVDSGSDDRRRYQTLCPESTQLLLGEHYLPILHTFSQTKFDHRAQTRNVNQVLVSCGATDPDNYTLSIVKLWQQRGWSKTIQLNCLLAANAPHAAGVNRALSESKLGRFIQQPENLIDVICESTICIGTASSALWERSTVGCPSAVFMGGADQAMNFKRYTDLFPELSVGDEKGRLDTNKIDALFSALYEGRMQLSSIRDKVKALCDGLGAKRIVNSMECA